MKKSIVIFALLALFGFCGCLSRACGGDTAPPVTDRKNIRYVDKQKMNTNSDWIAHIKSAGFPERTILAPEYKSIAHAVAFCGKNGGGTVVVPKGVWQTGPIHMFDDVCLHLEEGAEIVFSPRYSDYLPAVFTRWEGVECINFSPLIYARDCKHIAITGSGTLNGSGSAWWEWKLRQQDAAEKLALAGQRPFDPAERLFGREEDGLRPSFIQFVNCRDIFLGGITIKDGPMWTIHPVYCKNVLIEDVSIHTTGPNTDGIDPDSCCGVRIKNCSFDCGDDCIAIKSGLNEDGMRVGKPCEDIEISGCRMKNGHSAIALGSELSGGIRNIYVHDCCAIGTGIGIRLKTMPGRGGFVENVLFENIDMQNISGTAIHITLDYRQSTIRPQSENMTKIDEVVFRNILCNGAKYGIYACGVPGQIVSDIIVENCRINARTSRLFEGENLPIIEK